MWAVIKETLDIIALLVEKIASLMTETKTLVRQ